MHVLQGTNCGCSQLLRSRVSWTGECNFANALLAKLSPRLELDWSEAMCGWTQLLAIVVGSRRWLRRVKHMDTDFHWVQALVPEGRVTLGKKPTKVILADFLYKYVDAATMLTCLSGLGMKFQSGESRLTLRA